MNRYGNDAFIRLGKSRVTNRTAISIRASIASGAIPVKRVVLGQGVRLDHMAFREYKDASLWWIIAAASGIGWGMQIPAGTLLTIPTDISLLKATY